MKVNIGKNNPEILKPKPSEIKMSSITQLPKNPHQRLQKMAVLHHLNHLNSCKVDFTELLCLIYSWLADWSIHHSVKQ